MRPYKMTVMRTDIIFMHRLTSILSKAKMTSSPTFMDSMAVSIASSMVSTLIAVWELMTPPAALTTCCPTSKTAIVMVKVFDTIQTATHILKKYLKNIHVSISCMLFFSVSMVISS